MVGDVALVPVVHRQGPREGVGVPAEVGVLLSLAGERFGARVKFAWVCLSVDVAVVLLVGVTGPEYGALEGMVGRPAFAAYRCRGLCQDNVSVLLVLGSDVMWSRARFMSFMAMIRSSETMISIAMGRGSPPTDLIVLISRVSVAFSPLLSQSFWMLLHAFSRVMVSLAER